MLNNLTQLILLFSTAVGFQLAKVLFGLLLVLLFLSSWYVTVYIAFGLCRLF